MKRMRSFAALVVALLGSGAALRPNPDFEVDVLVYGGTSAGVIAAYTARRYGKSVLLVEPGRHLGGVSSGGAGSTDNGNKDAPTRPPPRLFPPPRRHHGQFPATE